MAKKTKKPKKKVAKARPEGRPPKFKSVEQAERLIEAYLESCFELRWFDELVRNKKGEIEYVKKGKTTVKKTKPVQQKVQTVPFTVTGLALSLGTTRKTLMDYESIDNAPKRFSEKEKQEFCNAIKRAKAFVENYAELKLLEGGHAAGPIFALKNFGWRDKQEMKHSGEVVTGFRITRFKGSK